MARSAIMTPPHSLPIAMSETSIAGGGRVVRFMTVSLARELGILLSLSVMFPFMIHLLPVPENAQLGPRLLPMFYAPLLAALWGRTRSALGVALFAPWLNWILTSHPTPPTAIVMMVQLLVFVFALRAMVIGFGARCSLAALAYFSGLAAAVLTTMAFPALIGGQAALTWAAQSVTLGLPGIALLVLISWLALRYYPPGAGGGPPVAA
jgi:uncharacterized membrane protein